MKLKLEQVHKCMDMPQLPLWNVSLNEELIGSFQEEKWAQIFYQSVYWEEFIIQEEME